MQLKLTQLLFTLHNLLENFFTPYLQKIHSKAGSHGAICLIRILLCYCTEFKAIIHESMDLEGAVCDTSHHLKAGAHDTICLRRLFSPVVLSSKR